MAVELQGVCASYCQLFRKTTPVLKDIDLHIAAGQIYGILGPSGCGKTTLLRCMLGRHKLDKGTVTILGQPLGTPGLGVPGPAIGYMPQDLAIAMDLTIAETLWYFSCLVGMDQKQMTERKLYLLKFLNLTEESRLVRDLSGGQRRRVSLAATLLHQPQILILDEPTVGVDPQLRFSIWEHLTMLARDMGTTIIITTHYTEEARKANCIGLMRNGRFLVQAEPNQLLQAFAMTSLESVFLHLCNKDRETQIQVTSCCTATTLEYNDNSKKCVNSSKIIENNEQTGKRCKFTPKSTISRRLFALVVRNAIVMWRNKGAMLFQLVMPMLHVVLFYIQFGAEHYDFQLGVVNDDQSFLGGVYLNTIDKTLIAQAEFPSKELALESVRNGKLIGTLYIPENFSEAILTRYLHGHSTSNDTVDDSSIRVWFDMSHFQAVQLMTQELWTSFEDFIGDSLTYNYPVKAAVPISFEKPVYGDSHPKPVHFIMASLFAHIPFFMAAILTALVFVRERDDGLMDRSWVAGITGFEVTASHLITQGIFMICETSLPVIWYFGIINNSVCHGPLELVILQVFLQGFCGLVYGLTLSAVLPNESSVILACVGTLMICLNICGFTWPMEAIPIWLKPFGYFWPQTTGARGIRSVMLRGWTMANFQVLISVLFAILWSAIGIGVATFAMHLRR